MRTYEVEVMIKGKEIYHVDATDGDDAERKALELAGEEYGYDRDLDMEAVWVTDKPNLFELK